MAKIKERKSEHIRISLEEKIETGTSGFEDIILVHDALAESDLKGIKLSTELFKKKLKYPLLVEAITGGTEEAKAINEGLADVAGKLGIGMAVGSQRPAIEDPSVADTFRVIKKGAKNTLKIANLGAVQLNYGYGVRECEKAVEMISADALALHFNALQEIIQPEGNTNFAGLLKKIKGVCANLSVPVIAKEVGCGMSKKAAEKLLDAGVECIDVGGYGGTSWNRIEAYRAGGAKRELSEAFDNWGLPTAISLLEIKDLDCKKIASGGIRTGVDVAKSIVLGADAAGMALPLLKALKEDGEKGVERYLLKVVEELKVCMMLVGASDISTLKEVDYRLVGKAALWAPQIV